LWPGAKARATTDLHYRAIRPTVECQGSPLPNPRKPMLAARPLLTTCLTDRRAEPRFTSSLRVVCEVESATGQPRLMQGSSTNISRHGVAVILPRPLARG